MNNNELMKIANDLSTPPKGILAADESTNTIKKRFDTINLDSTFETRRRYRELLFKTDKLNEHISGIIMFDETIRQSTSDSETFPAYLQNQNIIPGIKVDTGAIQLNQSSKRKNNRRY